MEDQISPPIHLGNGTYVSKSDLQAFGKAWREKQDASYRAFYKAAPETPIEEIGSDSTLAGSQGPQFGGVVSPDYAGFVSPASRPLIVARLFGADTTNSNLIRFVKGHVETDDSTVGPTAEGAQFGEANTEFFPSDFYVRDHTGAFVVTEDFLNDSSGLLAAYINRRLAYIIQRAEEKELVSGDATGNHMRGLLSTGDPDESPETHTQGGSEPIATAIANIALQTFDASGLFPSWVLMSAASFYKYLVAQSAGSAAGDGPFAEGFPFHNDPRIAWGMQVAVSNACPDDKMIVGSPAAATRFVRQGVTIESSFGYKDFFGKGLVLVRGKLRSTLAYEYPSGIGILTLNATSSIPS